MSIPQPPSLLSSSNHSEQAAPSITLATVTASSSTAHVPSENRASIFIASHIQPTLSKDPPPATLSQFTYNMVEKSMGWTAQTGAFVGTEIGRRFDWLRRSASTSRWSITDQVCIAEAEWGDILGKKLVKNDSIPKRHSILQLNEQEYKALVFGVPVVEAVQNTALMDHHGPVPCVVVRCIEYLDVVGLKEVGLYRVPGRHSQVNRLRSIFDAGLDYDFHAHNTPVHDVATLLKDYFRKLPDPLLPDTFLSKFLGCLSHAPPQETTDTITLDIRPNDVAVLDQLHELALHALPLHSRALLRILCAHLNRLARYSKENKMTLSNLGLIFCPTLGLTSAAFVWMVRGWDSIFSLVEEKVMELHALPPIPKMDELHIPELLAQMENDTSDQLVGVSLMDQEGEMSFGVLNMVKRPSRRRMPQEQHV